MLFSQLAQAYISTLQLLDAFFLELVSEPFRMELSKPAAAHLPPAF
jgi:hypothetical protein